MIDARNISITFGGSKGLDSVSFSVQHGEVFGIVGPDGAGKSTLLRILSTILEPDEGSITWGGTSIFDDPFSVKEKLAYMPQRFGLYEDLTVEENINFFGRLFNVSRKDIRRRQKRLYQFSRLEPFKNRLAGQLSGGMKQKLGLACCLVHSPDLVLLDEPTNGVDPVSRREFWQILYDLLKEGVTIIVSTAYLDEAERCNRIALIYEGKFIRLGEPISIKNEIKRKLLEIVLPDPHRAEAVLSRYPEYKNSFRTGNSLRLFVDRIPEAQKKITYLLRKNKCLISSISEKIPSLEDCFINIIGGERDR